MEKWKVTWIEMKKVQDRVVWRGIVGNMFHDELKVKKKKYQAYTYVR